MHYLVQHLRRYIICERLGFAQAGAEVEYGRDPSRTALWCMGEKFVILWEGG